MTRIEEIALTPAEVASLSKEAALIDVDFPYAEDVSRELLGRVLAERTYLLEEVKRLEGEIVISKPLYSRRQLDERLQSAEALALSLAEALERCSEMGDELDRLEFAKAALSSPALARIRGKE